MSLSASARRPGSVRRTAARSRAAAVVSNTTSRQGPPRVPDQKFEEVLSALQQAAEEHLNATDRILGNDMEWLTGEMSRLKNRFVPQLLEEETSIERKEESNVSEVVSSEPIASAGTKRSSPDAQKGKAPKQARGENDNEGVTSTKSNSSLPENLAALRVVELRDLLSERGLSKTGRKAELIKRLQDAIESAEAEENFEEVEHDEEEEEVEEEEPENLPAALAAVNENDEEEEEEEDVEEEEEEEEKEEVVEEEAEEEEEVVEMKEEPETKAAYEADAEEDDFEEEEEEEEEEENVEEVVENHQKEEEEEEEVVVEKEVEEEEEEEEPMKKEEEEQQQEKVESLVVEKDDEIEAEIERRAAQIREEARERARAKMASGEKERARLMAMEAQELVRSKQTQPNPSISTTTPSNTQFLPEKPSSAPVEKQSSGGGAPTSATSAAASKDQGVGSTSAKVPKTISTAPPQAVPTSQTKSSIFATATGAMSASTQSFRAAVTAVASMTPSRSQPQPPQSGTSSGGGGGAPQSSISSGGGTGGGTSAPTNTNTNTNTNTTRPAPPPKTAQPYHHQIGSIAKAAAARTPTSAKRPEDNYEMSEREDSSEDDSPSHEHRKGKRIPTWAKGEQLEESLHAQYGGYGGPRLDPDRIFAEVNSCDLEAIFERKQAAYRKRGSSANWFPDRLTESEREMYRRDLGLDWKRSDAPAPSSSSSSHRK